MLIRENPINPLKMLERLNDAGIRYGENRFYSSPISPVIVCLSPDDVLNFQVDLNELSKLYCVASDLYLKALDEPSNNWIRMCVESSLSKHQIIATQITAKNRVMPMLTRVDYISFDSDFRKVAEVQWKSGGPGFLIAHDMVYREALIHDDFTMPFGDLVGMYISALKRMLSNVNDSTGCVLNEVRSEWIPGESFLAAQSHKNGIDYVPVGRKTIADNLHRNSTNRYCYSNKPISVLRGRGFSDLISGKEVVLLANKAACDNIWVEIPLNYILRQKWPMALPFIPEHRHLFSDHLRSILAPTIITIDQAVDFSPIVEYFPQNYAEKLLKVRNLYDLSELPESLRRLIVIKNSGGAGEMQNRGKGVFRLTGSKSYVQNTLIPINKNNDTWIIQRYIPKAYPIPLVKSEGGITNKLHARFMLFGERNGSEWSIQGALTNFAQNWKVTGSNQTPIAPVRIIREEFL